MNRKPGIKRSQESSEDYEKVAASMDQRLQ